MRQKRKLKRIVVKPGAPDLALSRSMKSGILLSVQQLELINEEEIPARLDVFLSKNLPNYSRTYFQSLIEQEKVLLNGKLAKKREEVKKGDKISLEIIPPPKMEARAEEIPLDIVYEDDYFLAINKPSGMVTHPAPGNTSGTFANALLYHLGDESPFEDEELRPGIVHRLDKDTSGLLLAAKTQEAHLRLSEAFQRRDIQKEYLAITTGGPNRSHIIENEIGRHPYKRKEMAVLPTGGKIAITEVLPLAHNERMSLLLLRPKTGRTHQLRVHLKSIGSPILGDVIYGKKCEHRLMLHAWRLTFIHPITKVEVRLHAPIPAEMGALIAKLNRSTLPNFEVTC